MRTTADTNVLLRAILDDHPVQSPLAQSVLRSAEMVAVSLTTLCEFVWVLRQGDRRSQAEVVAVLQALLNTPNARWAARSSPHSTERLPLCSKYRA